MTRTERTALATTTAKLWSRNLMLYAGARFVSAAGDAMLPVALTVALLDLGYGTSGVGYALAAWMAPFAVLVLFGGVLADRFSPRRMMILADAVRLVAQGALALTLATGDGRLWHFLVVQAFSGAASALFQPGMASLVPRVTSDVQRANAVLRVGESLARIVGPALGGTLVAVASVSLVVGINAGTFGFSALCLLLLRIEAPARGAEPSDTTWRSLRTGWREFRSRSWLWAVIAAWAVQGLLVFGPQLPLLASVIVKAHDSTGYGTVEAALGAGAVVGGLLALRIRPSRPLTAGLLAMMLYSLPPLAAAAGGSVPVLAASSAAAGLGWSFWSVMWATSVQTHVPEQVLNRVYAYDVAGSVLSIPVGRALAGPVGDVVGEADLLVATSVIGLAGCLALLCVPTVRGLTRADGPPRAEAAGDA
ncbi:MFS transporter [Streptomyces sp. NPDC058398]|uniref:MFS transporter n=1 Tax=Streptomyces sp. NPDC058398 TaxID=3346479 RepID=UPI00364D6336